MTLRRRGLTEARRRSTVTESMVVTGRFGLKRVKAKMRITTKMRRSKRIVKQIQILQLRFRRTFLPLPPFADCVSMEEAFGLGAGANMAVAGFSSFLSSDLIEKPFILSLLRFVVLSLLSFSGVLFS